MPEWSATGGGADREQPTRGPHPDLETLAAYVDGTLDVPRRGEVARHLGDCDECHDLVAEVLKTEEILDSASDTPEPVPVAAPLPILIPISILTPRPRPVARTLAI
jgi:anti-sigma factor RsiW